MVTNTKTNQLGKLVRRERKAQRLTQTQLGELSGTGLNFVSQLERGKRTVRFDKLQSVLQILGLEFYVRRGQGSLVVAEGLRDEA